jgi:replicative DNA helicase
MDKVVDKTTENVVLGSLVLNPSEYNIVAPYIPEPKVFSQNKSKLLWIKIGKMIMDNQHVDNLTICSSLTGVEKEGGLNESYVIECTSSACSLGMTHVYAQKVYEKYLLRKIVAEADGIKHNVTHHGDNIYDLVTSTHTLMGELLRVRPGSAFNITKEMGDTITSMSNNNVRMIKTGYGDIDKFAGGLTRGEISIVGGRPGHGKTTFLVNLLAKFIHNGYKVAMFNRELPNTELLKKMICIEEPKLSYSSVRRGNFNDNQVELIKNVRSKIIDKYSEDKLVMFDNVRNFSKTASEVKKFNPDVIIDDYIQLVTPAGKEEKRRLQLERICNDYKWLAKENNCAVVLASQLNRALESRGGEAKWPRLSDLAESGAIEQVAENVFFIYYPHKVDPSRHEKNEIHLIASKVRYGETGSIQLGYSGDICTIWDKWGPSLVPEGRVNEKEQLSF